MLPFGAMAAGTILMGNLLRIAGMARGRVTDPGLTASPMEVSFMLASIPIALLGLWIQVGTALLDTKQVHED